MKNLNQVMLSGTVAGLQHGHADRLDGRPYVSFDLVSRVTYGEQVREDFHPVTIWGKIGETNIAPGIVDGVEVIVSGVLVSRKYISQKTNAPYVTTKVTAHSVIPVATAPTRKPDDDEEIPF